MPTDLGRAASFFYLQHDTIEAFNEGLGSTGGTFKTTTTTTSSSSSSSSSSINQSSSINHSINQ
jgi:hypothetical protein